ncbi:glycosyltransferase [Gammaproteobacteria bacterium]|nr:glycosyltransferase [Gammaproteobacteria bacterium]
MNNAMASDLKKISMKESTIIGNFIDEARVLTNRRNFGHQGAYRFVCVGELVERKGIIDLIKTAKLMKGSGVNFQLAFYGEGDLEKRAAELIEQFALSELVFLKGYTKDIFGKIAEADVLVSASYTEGTSRSALESLCLGIPCVMRDIPENRELIDIGVNGDLFRNLDELPAKLVKMASYSRVNKTYKGSLIPVFNKQMEARSKTIRLIQSHLK